MRLSILTIIMSYFLLVNASLAKDTVTVDLYKATVNDTKELLGKVTLKDSKKGLKLTVKAKGFSAGEHGFHVHENNTCAALEKDGKLIPALAAGGHLDPHKTGKHAGPKGEGHKGDLPLLKANSKGVIKQTVHTKMLSLKDVKGRSLVIHEGGDNYTDTPVLGGGGGRFACGTIAK